MTPLGVFLLRQSMASFFCVSTVWDSVHMQVAAINTAMASLTKTLQIFPVERQIAQREMGSGAYTVGAYFSSKLAAELPITSLFPALFGLVMYPMTGLHKSFAR